MTDSQADIIGTGAADGADGAHVGDVLVQSHDTGDAALFGDFKEEIRLGVAGLGQGLLDVVEHDRYGAVAGDVLLRLLTGEGVAVAGQAGAAGGLGLGIVLVGRLGGGGVGAGVSAAGGRGGTAGQTQEHGQGEQGTNQFFH